MLKSAVIKIPFVPSKDIRRLLTIKVCFFFFNRKSECESLPLYVIIKRRRKSGHAGNFSFCILAVKLFFVIGIMVENG